MRTPRHDKKNGFKCTRKDQLRLKLKTTSKGHKARTKRRRKATMACSGLRTVTGANGLTEKVWESRPGVGHTLDGVAENKGKGVVRNNLPGLFQGKEGNNWDDEDEDGDNHDEKDDEDNVEDETLPFMNPDRVSLNNLILEVLHPTPQAIDQIRLFHTHFIKACHALWDYLTLHHSLIAPFVIESLDEGEHDDQEEDEEDGKLPRKEREMKDEYQSRINPYADQSEFLIEMSWQIADLKTIVNGENTSDLPGTIMVTETKNPPMVILQRIYKGLTDLQGIWLWVIAEGTEMGAQWDLEAPGRWIEAIEKPLAHLRILIMMEAETKRRLRKEVVRSLSGTESQPLAARDQDLEDRDDEFKSIFVLLEKQGHQESEVNNLSLAIKEPKKYHSPSRSGCVCGEWCAGSSQSR